MSGQTYTVRDSRSIKQRAIEFTMSVLEHAEDWQEGQAALGDHPEFGPWLLASGDESSLAQDIIRHAEYRLGDRLPY